jgi:hypothetical protein
VDGQLNAKLADLELGAENTEVASRSALVSEDLLENWAAPEVSSQALLFPSRHMPIAVSGQTIHSKM